VFVSSCRINCEDVRLMLWDTAGQEEFDAITKAYYRGKSSTCSIYPCYRHLFHLLWTCNNPFQNITWRTELFVLWVSFSQCRFVLWPRALKSPKPLKYVVFGSQSEVQGDPKNIQPILSLLKSVTFHRIYSDLVCFKTMIDKCQMSLHSFSQFQLLVRILCPVENMLQMSTTALYMS
jgi:hypothetical protein